MYLTRRDNRALDIYLISRRNEYFSIDKERFSSSERSFGAENALLDGELVLEKSDHCNTRNSSRAGYAKFLVFDCLIYNRASCVH